MLRLINFICLKCGEEKEELLSENWNVKMLCANCQKPMKIFNFKNNQQRWFYQDTKKS